jgi:hypothetical protein
MAPQDVLQSSLAQSASVLRATLEGGMAGALRAHRSVYGVARVELVT